MDCAQSLAALASGRWEDWQGLGEDCTRADAERGLGDTGPGPDGSGRLGGAPASFRGYPSAPAAPYGVQLWFDLDRILLVQINSPLLDREPAAVLGPPEETRPSGLGAGQQQWIYPSRGLVLHLDPRAGELRRLYGFRPMTVDEFGAWWLSRVATERTRRVR